MHVTTIKQLTQFSHVTFHNSITIRLGNSKTGQEKSVNNYQTFPTITRSSLLPLLCKETASKK